MARKDPTEFARYGAIPRVIDEIQRGGDDLVLAIKYLVREVLALVRQRGMDARPKRPAWVGLLHEGPDFAKQAMFS